MKTFSILLAVVGCMLFRPSLLKAQSLTDSLNLKLEALSKQNSFPGFAVAVVNEKGIIYQNGFGYADLKSQSPFTEHTVLNIGSVSKTFIAASVMKLIDQGKLSLDTPINDVLPFPVNHPRFPNEVIRVKHLVTHTSGIMDRLSYNEDCYVLLEPLPNKLGNIGLLNKYMIKKIRKNELIDLGVYLNSYLVEGGDYYKKKNYGKTKPGTKYEYSNIASALAAYVVEIVSGQHYKEFVKSEILSPLKMTDSAWDRVDIPKEKLASIYFKNDVAVPSYTLVTYPDGGLLSSANNLAWYVHDMLKGMEGEGLILSENGYDNMFTKWYTDGVDDSGVFWDLSKSSRISHNGGDPGIFTNVVMERELGVAYILVCNKLPESKDMVEEIFTVWGTLLRDGTKLHRSLQADEME